MGEKILREAEGIAVKMTEDVVTFEPVIHCKDCLHWWKEERLCTHDKACDGNICVLECDANFFCARGER